VPQYIRIERRKMQSNIEINIIKNKAFQVFMEWGPNKRIPRAKRMTESFPKVEESIRNNWMQDFKIVNDKIWEFAENIKSTRHTKESFMIAFKELFPWMDNESLLVCNGLHNFYIVHEGYDK
jgi:hypothetical protein